jgi:ribosomal RNA-processing protein 1
MDKYFYLVRQVFYVSLRYLARNGYKDTQALEDLIASMVNTPLNARDAKIPNGLRYHILDIYIDELEKVDDENEADLPAEEFLAPIAVLSKECPTKSIRRQAKEVLADPRVRNWLGVEDDELAVEDEESEGNQQTSEAENGGGDWGGFED